MEVGGACAEDEGVEEERTEAAAVVEVVDVDGVFDGGGEGFAFMEGGETAPCDDFAGCFGDDDGVSGGAVGEPCGAVFGGFGGDLERAGGGEDVVVVDGVDGVEVGGGGVAERGGGHGGGGMEEGEGRRTGGLQQKPQPARGIDTGLGAGGGDYLVTLRTPFMRRQWPGNVQM